MDADAREQLDYLMKKAKLNPQERQLVLDRYVASDSAGDCTTNENLDSETMAVFKKLQTAAKQLKRAEEQARQQNAHND